MQDLRVVFLGTGAAAPSPQRNVAAVAMAFDGRALLFDCGEATQHQLMRAPLRPGSIETICITHLHGDHLYGLPGLIASLGLYGRERPLTLIGPRGLAAFVKSIPFLGAPYDVHLQELDEVEQVVLRGEGFRLEAAPLDHRVPCVGFALIEDDRPGLFDVDRARALGIPEGPLFGNLQRGEDVTLADGRRIAPHDVLGVARAGRRVAYCTDTRPCAGAIALARDAALLIHEATYANDLAAEAPARGHSTAEDAARIAKEANARRLFLTHFSPRYTEIAPLLDEARAIFPATEAAVDFGEVRV